MQGTYLHAAAFRMRRYLSGAAALPLLLSFANPWHGHFPPQQCLKCFVSLIQGATLVIVGRLPFLVGFDLIL